MDPEQPALATQLEAADTGRTAPYDSVVVGTGPAGLSIAAELAKRGLEVLLVGPDMCFVNNYGIFEDELEEIGGLEDTVVQTYGKMAVYLSETEEVDLGRRYVRVGRAELRAKLLATCRTGGVRYLEDKVEEVVHLRQHSELRLSGQSEPLRCRVPMLALGHNRELIKYEDGPRPTMQTAYGYEVSWKGHPWPVDTAVFMDFRHQDAEQREALEGRHGDGAREHARYPSILYAFPLDEDTVFLQETCLVAPTDKAVPFDELKERMQRRLQRMGIEGKIERVLEEEASWIPLGGTVPVAPQRAVAFGAAAGMVHPVSGYHVANMLTRAPHVAQAVAEGLRSDAEVPAEEAARRAWDQMWDDDRRRQQGFYEFGMRMMLTFDQPVLLQFFRTFFRLPNECWQSFLSHRLGGVALIGFALRVFAIAGNDIRLRLILHLGHEGAGVRVTEQYIWPVLRAAGLTAGRGGMATDRRAAWLPLLKAPLELDGSLPGDVGFDPAGFTKEDGEGQGLWLPPGYDDKTYCGSRVEYLREVEVLHGRWSMLAVVGCMAPEALGMGAWNEAPGTVIEEGGVFMNIHHLAMLQGDNSAHIRVVVAAQLVLMGGVELLRASSANAQDADARLYPGGLFDPLGLTVTSPERVHELRTAEVKHARLAMVAMTGVWRQVVLTHSGPLANWAHFTEQLHVLFVEGLQAGWLPLPAAVRGALVGAAVV